MIRSAISTTQVPTFPISSDPDGTRYVDANSSRTGCRALEARCDLDKQLRGTHTRLTQWPYQRGSGGLSYAWDDSDYRGIAERTRFSSSRSECNVSSPFQISYGTSSLMPDLIRPILRLSITGSNLRDYPPATADQRKAARRDLGLPEDGFVTLFFGRLEREKGVDLLLKAWRRLALPPDRACLLVVGSTNLGGY